MGWILMSERELHCIEVLLAFNTEVAAPFEQSLA